MQGVDLTIAVYATRCRVLAEPTYRDVFAHTCISPVIEAKKNRYSVATIHAFTLGQYSGSIDFNPRFEDGSKYSESGSRRE